MLTRMITGAFAAALTPLRAGGAELDEAAFEPYVAFLADGGIDGILALGTTGEGILFGRGRPAARARALPRRRRGAARRRRPLRRADDGRDGRARRPCRRGGRRRRRRDRAAVLPARRACARGAPRRGGGRLRAASLLRLRVRRPQRLRRAGRRDRAAARASDQSPRAEGLRQAVGGGRALPARRPRRLRRRRVARRPRARARRRRGRLGARGGLPRSSSPSSCASRPRSAPPRPTVCAGELDRFPFQAAAKVVAARRGVPIGPDVRPPLRRLTEAELAALDAVVILVAGGGAIGAGIAYRLALRGAEEVVLCDRGAVCSRLDREGDGRRPPAVLDRRGGPAGAGEHRLLRRARAAVLRPGRLPVPRDDRAGARRAGGAAGAAGLPGRPGRAGRRRVRRGPRDARRPRRRLLRRGRRRRPARRDARARPPRHELGVEVREHTPAETLLADADTARDRLRPLVGRRSPPRWASSCRCGRSAASCSRPSRSPRRRRSCRWWSRPRAASTSAVAATGSCSRWPTTRRASASRRRSTRRCSPTGSPALPTASRRPRAAGSTRRGRGSTT